AGARDFYDDELAEAVMALQRQKGLRPDGIIGSRMRAVLNAGAAPAARPSPASDVQRIIANMERWRWMPEDLGRFYVWDNVPEFTARVVKNGRLMHQAKIIVGKPDTQTELFSANMLDLVGNARLLAEDGNLVPVGRRPVVELDRPLRHAMLLEWAGVAESGRVAAPAAS